MARPPSRHLIPLLLLFFTASCSLTSSANRVGDLNVLSKNIPLGETVSVQTNVFMDAGSLDINGGASDLLESDFYYNVAALEPDVFYITGALTIRSPDVSVMGVSSWLDLEGYRYDWNLHFNQDIPMDMNIEQSSGQANLDLGELFLTRLVLNVGAGEFNIDLSGSRALSRVDIDAGAGKVALNLAGDWPADAVFNIHAGVGQLDLTIPRGVGVSADIEGGIQHVDAPGLLLREGAYINDAFGRSDVSLRIHIIAGIGQISLIPEE